MSASGMIPPPKTTMSSASALPEQLDDPGEQRHVRAGEHGEADGVGVLLQGGLRRSAPASGAGRCRRPPCRRRAGHGPRPWRRGRARRAPAWRRRSAAARRPPRTAGTSSVTTGGVRAGTAPERTTTATCDIPPDEIACRAYRDPTCSACHTSRPCKSGPAGTTGVRGAARPPARARGGAVTRHDGGEGPRTGTDGVAFPAAAGRSPVGGPAATDRAGRAAGRRRPLLTPGGVRGAVVEALWCSAHLAIYPLGLLRERAEPGDRYALEGLGPPAQRGLAERRHRGRRDADPAGPRHGRQPRDLHRAQARAAQAWLRPGRDDQLLAA